MREFLFLMPQSWTKSKLPVNFLECYQKNDGKLWIRRQCIKRKCICAEILIGYLGFKLNRKSFTDYSGHCQMKTELVAYYKIMKMHFSQFI